MRRSVYHNRAFTLIEIMVVISIIAIVLLAVARGYRNRDRSTKLLQCRANLVAIADAMEAFKQNEGEYIHSREYKFYDSSRSVKAYTVDLGGGTGDYYATEEDIDVSKLVELSNTSNVADWSSIKCFANLKTECPADTTEHSGSDTSYHVVCNPFNFTVYCTCGEDHNLSSGFPRYIHGVNSNGQVTVKAGLENAAGKTD